jgi:hypothetical protein
MQFDLRICVYSRYATVKNQVITSFKAGRFGLDMDAHWPGRRLVGPVAGWPIFFDVAIAHGWLELATGKTIEKMVL